MSRITVIAALIASAVALVRHEHVLDRSGMFGSCTSLSAPAPAGGEWLECRPGELTGYPDLSKDSCSRRGMRGDARYWICPTALIAARAPGMRPTR